jgi:SPP1 family phage portal protein
MVTQMLSNLTDRINTIIAAGAASGMTEKRFFEREIERWRSSKMRIDQIVGEKYYRGEHDILSRRRTVIGKGGQLESVENLPNNRVVDNQYCKMVDQKTNYLLGKPFTLKTDNGQYEQALTSIFNKRFHRMLQNLCEDSMNGGIGWVYVYYDEEGLFSFTRFAPYEVLPFWQDADHMILDCVVRLYEVETYEGEEFHIVEKVEIYKRNGIDRYILDDGRLIEDADNLSSPHMTLGGKPYAWERVPIVGFKYNDEEIPLICKVKSLQDALNVTLSDFQNNMQEDSRNTILVITNYDGENLADFRHNLAAYGAVKVKTIDGAAGGVDTLQVEVNAENYRSLLELFKKALIENAMGYDAKDDKMSGNPNQMNIQSMYSDIDLDANGMESEWQASFEDLLFFINAHLANTGQGHFQSEKVEIVFNRNILMNETDVINNIRSMVGILSDETLLAKNPWITDVNAELNRIQSEKEAAMKAQADIYGSAFMDEHTQDRGI